MVQWIRLRMEAMVPLTWLFSKAGACLTAPPAFYASRVNVVYLEPRSLQTMWAEAGRVRGLFA